MVTNSFSNNYREARQKFCHALHEAQGHHEQVVHPERGPDGGELTTDVGYIGPQDAEAVLVLISGTHGVEGFCGSGLQIELMNQWDTSRRATTCGLLVIHALNPYGFAWLRRVTHENIDLNRNWVDFSQPLPANPGYDELAEVLVPRLWTQETVRQRAEAERKFAAAHGYAALGKALNAGQYTHPDGIHYGGCGSSWSRQTQTAIFTTHLSQAKRIAIIDVHSGLGPRGIGERIMTMQPASAAFGRATKWFGYSVASTIDGTATSSSIQGDALSAASGILSHAEVTAVALEFGTQPLDVVHEAVCADVWLHTHGDPKSALGQSLKQRVREAFYVDMPDWKGMVVGQGLLICRQAIAGLIGH